MSGVLAIPRESIDFWRVQARINGKASLWEFPSESAARFFKRQLDEDPEIDAQLQYVFNE